MNVLLYILAILPALGISYAVYRLDRFQKESFKNLVICFVLGMMVTFPAMKVEEIELLMMDEAGKLTFGELLLSTFGLVAIGEEFFKLIPLMLFAFPRKFFDEPFDGIVYGVMIAMGFAAVENVFYAYRFGMNTTLIRAFTAVPAHGALGVIIGYYAGRAKLDIDNRNRLLGIGFLQVILIHGLYDFFIVQNYDENLMAITALILTLSIYYAIRLIRTEMTRLKTIVTMEELSEEEAEIKQEEENEIAEAIFKDLRGEKE